MVYAHNWICRVLFGICVLATISSCGIQTAKELSNIPVTRSTPEKWYDSTYLQYFDAYGPVRKIVLYASGDNVGQWEMRFNQSGRLTTRGQQDSAGSFIVHYGYHHDGRLKQINSVRNGREYRLSEYHYNNSNELEKIRYYDYASGRQFHSKHTKQLIDSGWFAIERPVEQIELPSYRQFNQQGQLVWSSRGGVNHGPGQQFYLSVSDAINNANVVHENTPNMRGRGGYAYEYDAQGRLHKVSSFNGNNNDVYHTTIYAYNDFGLLRDEVKIVVGNSLFNQAVQPPQNQSVSYQYHQTDQYGNWLQRTVIVVNGGAQSRFHERRTIAYF